MNPKIEEFITAVFLEVAEKGIDQTLTKKHMKNLYQEYCETSIDKTGEN